MSSEMRELVKEMRAGTPCYVAKVRGGRCVNGAECLRCAERLDWAGRLEAALLARTEAGADGVVAWILRTGHGTALHEGARPPVEGVGWKPLFDRPQDASGDAEALQDLMTTVRAVAFSGDYGISDEAIAALSDALDDAMQAKEAK